MLSVAAERANCIMCRLSLSLVLYVFKQKNELGENKLLRPKSSWIHIRQKRSEVEKNTPNRINENRAQRTFNVTKPIIRFRRFGDEADIW